MSTLIPSAELHLGPITLHWYGIMIFTGIITGYLVALKRAKKFQIPATEVENLFLLSIPAALIGARLFHVLMELDYYKHHVQEIPNVAAGGLAVHGAIFGAWLVIYLYTRKRKLNLWSYLDLAAPSMALGQAIGRFGNFFNQELYGSPTSLPWKIFIEPLNRLPGYFGSAYYHPAFLYESLLDLLAFVILLYVARRLATQTPGKVFALYLIFYGCIRFLMEFIRIDEDPMMGPLKMAHLTSLALILGGSWLWLKIKNKPAIHASS